MSRLAELRGGSHEDSDGRGNGAVSARGLWVGSGIGAFFRRASSSVGCRFLSLSRIADVPQYAPLKGTWQVQRPAMSPRQQQRDTSGQRMQSHSNGDFIADDGCGKPTRREEETGSLVRSYLHPLRGSFRGCAA